MTPNGDIDTIEKVKEATDLLSKTMDRFREWKEDVK